MGPKVSVSHVTESVVVLAAGVEIRHECVRRKVIARRVFGWNRIALSKSGVGEIGRW